MKLLLDECIDRRLAREFPEQDIRTVWQMGWSGTKNGKLLTLAEKEFDVFITVDRNLSFEQNLPKFNIAVVVLKEIYCCEYRSSERFAGLDCRNANYFSS